ncbi:tyrosine-type recombinase/integrase [Lysinibacillus xylanilyticus]|uniref:tyrosine-type recombinase/integrase n=1 Tax=Lysinibacillus xylanilyticus TaxID=582475 RepID=UPI00380562CF
MLDKRDFEVSFNNFEKSEIAKIKSFLPLYSSSNKFEDDIWVMDKLLSNQRVTQPVRKVYFTQIPDKEKNLVKIFVLVKLSMKLSIRTIKTNIYGVKNFIEFLSNEMSSISLVEVNRKIILEFEDNLKMMELSFRSKEAIWGGIASFFTELGRYEIVPLIKFGKNPFSVPRNKRATSNKYIDEFVIKQLDEIFRNEDIPLVYRTTYWICRLIPNRISEVSSMKIGCIKPYINEKVITIPSFKQNGGHEEPEIKQIALIEEGMGKYLLDLIRQQEEVSKSLQGYIGDNEKGFLLTSFTSQYIPSKNKYQILTGNANKITKVNEANFNKTLNTYCKRYKVKNENGGSVKISSHLFRHNGITDRLYEGFRLIDIMSMTNHKTSTMIVESYVHVNEEELRHASEKILKEEKLEVLFRGKIINTNNPDKMDKILKRPFAHKIGRLGICSDISNCPSQMFECLNDCSNFIPNADELDYFKEQVRQWEEKLLKFKDHPYMGENAKYNLELNTRVVERITRAIEGK